MAKKKCSVLSQDENYQLSRFLPFIQKVIQRLKFLCSLSIKTQILEASKTLVATFPSTVDPYLHKFLYIPMNGDETDARFSIILWPDYLVVQ